MVDSIEAHIISNSSELDIFLWMWESVNNYGVDCTIKVLMLDYSKGNLFLTMKSRLKYIKQKTVPNTRTTSMNQSWYRNELLTYMKYPFIMFYDDWQRPDQYILVRHLEFLKKGYIVSGNQVRQCSSGGEFWTCNASV
jgi:hypothetical protein